MSRSAEEIQELRQLYARVYGPFADASQADVDRLVELTGQTSEDVTPVAQPPGADDANRDVASSEHVPVDLAAPLRSRVWSILRSRQVVSAAFALMFLAGMACGFGIGAGAAPPGPMRGIVPPNPEMYRTDSITFYGELDGVRVWTGNALEDESDCLSAMTDTFGVVRCLGPGESVVAVVLAGDGPTRSARRVSFDFADPDARPVIGRWHP